MGIQVNITPDRLRKLDFNSILDTSFLFDHTNVEKPQSATTVEVTIHCNNVNNNTALVHIIQTMASGLLRDSVPLATNVTNGEFSEQRRRYNRSNKEVKQYSPRVRETQKNKLDYMTDNLNLDSPVKKHHHSTRKSIPPLGPRPGCVVGAELHPEDKPTPQNNAEEMSAATVKHRRSPCGGNETGRTCAKRKCNSLSQRDEPTLSERRKLKRSLQNFPQNTHKARAHSNTSASPKLEAKEAKKYVTGKIPSASLSAKLNKRSKKVCDNGFKLYKRDSLRRRILTKKCTFSPLKLSPSRVDTSISEQPLLSETDVSLALEGENENDSNRISTCTQVKGSPFRKLKGFCKSLRNRNSGA